MTPSGSISIMQQIDHAELARLLDEAAEKGAKRALASVGLHDQDAGDDVRELRGLLESWRETKKVVWPARKEAMQMTAYVFAFVFVMALFLWLTDKTLEWVLFDLVLGWRN